MAEQIESIYIKDEDGNFAEYITIDDYAKFKNCSRQSIYMRAKYCAPAPIEYVRLLNIYLIKKEQGEENAVRIETSHAKSPK